MKKSRTPAQKPRRVLHGGKVIGPGGPRDDRIPVRFASGGLGMVSNSEYIMPADSTARFLPALEAMRMATHKFQDGGLYGTARTRQQQIDDAVNAASGSTQRPALPAPIAETAPADDPTYNDPARVKARALLKATGTPGYQHGGPVLKYQHGGFNPSDMWKNVQQTLQSGNAPPSATPPPSGLSSVQQEALGRYRAAQSAQLAAEQARMAPPSQAPASWMSRMTGSPVGRAAGTALKFLGSAPVQGVMAALTPGWTGPAEQDELQPGDDINRFVNASPSIQAQQLARPGIPWATANVPPAGRGGFTDTDVRLGPPPPAMPSPTATPQRQAALPAPADTRPQTASWADIVQQAPEADLKRLQRTYQAAGNLTGGQGFDQGSFQATVANRLGYALNPDGTYRRSAPALSGGINQSNIAAIGTDAQAQSRLAQEPAYNQLPGLQAAGNRLEMERLARESGQQRLPGISPPSAYETELRNRNRQSALSGLPPRQQQAMLEFWKDQDEAQAKTTQMQLAARQQQAQLGQQGRESQIATLRALQQQPAIEAEGQLKQGQVAQMRDIETLRQRMMAETDPVRQRQLAMQLGALAGNGAGARHTIVPYDEIDKATGEVLKRAIVIDNFTGEQISLNAPGSGGQSPGVQGGLENAQPGEQVHRDKNGLYAVKRNGQWVRVAEPR